MLIIRLPFTIVKTKYLENLEERADQLSEQYTAEIERLDKTVRELVDSHLNYKTCFVCGSRLPSGGIHGSPDIKNIKESHSYCLLCWHATRDAARDKNTPTERKEI